MNSPSATNEDNRPSQINDYLIRLRLVQHSRQRSRLPPSSTQQQITSSMSNISSTYVSTNSHDIPDLSQLSLTSTYHLTKKPINIQDLPEDLLELIIRYATETNDGMVPFPYWSLTSVSHRFRAAIFSIITNVELVRCYDMPQIKLLPQDRPSAIMKGPLLNCHRLQQLDISGCDTLTDEHVGKFLRSTHPLRSFTAVICHKQTDLILHDLANRSSSTLRNLDITGCDRFRHDALFPRQREVFTFQPCAALTNSSLERVGTLCKELRSLTLSKALVITDIGLQSLSKLPKLEYLYFRGLTGISDEGISYLADGQGRLHSIKLMSCGMITDSGLESLAFGHATKRLEHISISFNSRVTGKGIQTLVCHLPFLEELNIDNCQEILEDWCNNVSDNISPIKKLMFRGVSLELSEQGIRDMSRIVQLESLDLSYVGTINASILQLLNIVAPSLKTLVLEACNKVDDDAARVLSSYSTIRQLNISWCSVSSTGLREMVSGPIGKELRLLRVGPLNGDERDTVLCNVGKECTNLEKLILHGEVNEDTIDWLRENTRAILECNDVVLRRSQRRRIRSFPVDLGGIDGVSENLPQENNQQTNVI